MATTLATRCMLAGLVAFAGAAGTSAAPSPAPLAPVQDAKAELEKKLATLDKKDANAVFQLALWCEQNSLKTDSKRLLRDVIKVDPDHAEARELLGYEKYNGKWLTKREIEREKAKAEEAEMAAKGLKKWKNEWVPAEDYERLEKGLVKYEGDGGVQWVSPEKKERLEKGMQLRNGIWMTKEDVARYDKGEFKVGDKWLTEAEADKVHADFTNPWVLESDWVSLTTTCKVAFARTALVHADRAVQKAYELLGQPLPKPEDFQKLSVILVKDISDYTQLGDGVSDAFDAPMSSSWSTFVLTDPNSGRFGAVTQYETLAGGQEKDNDNFSLGHVRFAAAAAAVRNMTFAEPPPPWLFVGVASYCERYWNPTFDAKTVRALAKWTLDTLMKEGGTIDLKQYFEPFQADRRSILQAGAVIGYLTEGQNHPKKVAEGWAKVKAGLQNAKEKGLLKEFLKLETVLGKDADKEFQAYVASITG